MQMMTQSPTSLQTFLTCPRQYQAKYITKEVKFQANAHAEFGDLVHKAIEAHLKDDTPLPLLLQPMAEILGRMKPVLLGAEVRYAVDKLGRPVEFFDKAAEQRCIVDAVLANTDRSHIVCIDWKTGKKREAQTQHDFIKKCVRAAYPQSEITTLFIYLFQGKSDRQLYGGQELSQLAHDMGELSAAYATGNFPPKPSGLCRKWCDVLSCPHNGRA